eukprot:PhF_6_TR25276/c0_g1_i1/m.34839
MEGSFRYSKKDIPESAERKRLSQAPSKAKSIRVTKSSRNVTNPVGVSSLIEQKRKKEFMYRSDWPNMEDMGVAEDTVNSPDAQRAEFMELVSELRSTQPSRQKGNKGKDDSKVRLPTASELQTLPPHLQEHFHQLALVILRTYLYPRCIRHNRIEWRKRLIANQLAYIPKLSVSSLKTYALFAEWPDDVLKHVCDALCPHVVERGEYLIHEDEKVGSGIFFVMTGQVHQMKKKSRSSKSIGYDNTEVIATTTAPTVFGEFSFLTEEPRLISVRALTTCTMWILSKLSFNTYLSLLPKDKYASIIGVAFTKRNQAMYINYPMNAESLLKYAIFSLCNNDVLSDIVGKLEPFAVPKHFVLCRAEEPAKYMYFIRHGKCGTYRYGTNFEEIQVGTVEHGTLIGDSALLHAANHDLTVRTLTNCDTWRLSKLSFDTAVRNHPTQYSHMMDSARLKRQEEMSTQQMRYREAVMKIPLISPHLKTSTITKELLSLFTPYVYKPLHLLCATSLFCDRMIILLKGRVRVGKDMALSTGECIGFTCVVPHRWAQTALTLDIVEVLELKRDAYKEFLVKHGLLSEIVHNVKMLLFPRAFPKQQVLALHSTIQQNRSPIMYPVSYGDEVNLTEHGFLTEVPAFTGKPMKDVTAHFWEAPKKKSPPKSQTPGPDTRPLTRGPLWRKATRHLWLPNLRLELKYKQQQIDRNNNR